MTLADPAVTDPARAAALDATDPLSGFRERFVIDDPSLVYLDGNSLGRLPKATRARLARVIDDEWGSELIRAWDHWLDLPLRVGDRLAAAVISANPGEVVIADSTTVNLYRLAHAALAARPDRRTIVVDRSEFPTDRYVLEGLAGALDRRIRWLESDPVEGPTAPDLATALDADVALVVLSHVNYRSAAIADLPALTAMARDAGALLLWDLCHAAGSTRVDLAAAGADLAVGCTYKFLNAGPGAPAFLYVRRDLQDELRNPIQGWFGQRDQFAMGPAYDARPGIGAWLTGTPTITAVAAVDEGVGLVEEAGIDAIRTKAIGLTAYAIELHEAWLAPLGFGLGSPREDTRRGSHVAVRHPEARSLTERLTAAGVLTDFREPDSVRLGLPPLNTSYADVRLGIDRLRSLAADRDRR
jgi:kynureninase